MGIELKYSMADASFTIDWIGENIVECGAFGYVKHSPFTDLSPKSRSQWREAERYCRELPEKLYDALVGNQAGVEFLAFKEIAAQFDDTHELMTNPNKKINIPEKADQRYAFCAAVAYHLWRGRSPEEEEKLLSGFYRIAMALPSDFATMLMMDALTGNRKTDAPSLFADKLYNHKGYTPWAKKHGKAMRARMSKKGF